MDFEINDDFIFDDNDENLIENIRAEEDELSFSLEIRDSYSKLSNIFDNQTEEGIDHFIFTHKDLIITSELTQEQYKILLNKIKKIYISGFFDDLITFINNNKDFLKGKSIRINIDDLELSQESIEKIMAIYEILPDAVYDIKGNEMPAKAMDIKKTIEQIQKVDVIVNKSSLSPLEKAFVCYDMVRESIYKKEAQGEDYTLSRDLTQISTGDHIVCLGFAHKLQALLDRSNVPNKCVTLINPVGRGHARNLIYVNDDKYNVHGLYFIDATFDSRKQKDSNEHRNNVSRFARSFNEMQILDEKTYYYEKYPYYNEKHVDGINFEILAGTDFMNIQRMMDKEIEFIKIVEMGENEINELISDIYDNTHRPIPKDTFIKLLYNVRKFEASINKEFACFTKEDIEEAFYSHTRIKKYQDPFENLLKAMFEINEDQVALEEEELVHKFLKKHF